MSDTPRGQDYAIFSEDNPIRAGEHLEWKFMAENDSLAIVAALDYLNAKYRATGLQKFRLYRIEPLAGEMWR